MSSNNDPSEIRVKVTGADFDRVAQVLQEIHSLFGDASCSTSTVMRSQPRGFHGFITIWKGGDPAGPKTIRRPSAWEVARQ